MSFDLLVIGAGPAGLAAAAAAAGAGAGRVALLDAGLRPGGQFWRHRKGDAGRGHHEWRAFQQLVGELRRHQANGLVSYLPGHAVWHLEGTSDGFVAHVVADDPARAVRGRGVVIATGAYDRSLPFPGWTLPGVMTAGAAQALLKGQGVVVGRRVVVGGTGPFLLPVAAALVQAGADVAAVLEAGRPTAAAQSPITLARSMGKLREGAGYRATLARHRVPYRMRRAVIAANGRDAVTAVTTAALDADWRVVAGSEERIECDAVAVSYGFTPQVELALDLGCETTLDADGSLVVTTDPQQQSSVKGAYVAGEVCGVGGQALASVEGELAGLHAAAALAGTSPDGQRVSRLERERAKHRAFAALLARAWPVMPGWRTWLTPETLVCRCEEVPAPSLQSAVTDLGATDARGAKLFSRAGMGACQGRVCGFAAAALTADALHRDVTPEDLASIARRPVSWPITLGALAAGADPSTANHPHDEHPEPLEAPA